MIQLALALFIVATSSTNTAHSATVRRSNFQFLSDLSSSWSLTAGDCSGSWVAGNDCSTFGCVTCDQQGFITAFSLHDVTANTVLPKSTSNLVRLRHLSIVNVSLQGGFPPPLVRLRRLTHLDISKNMVVGPIPSEMHRFKNLQFLSLAYNLELAGSLPRSIGRLRRLKSLSVRGTALDGVLPRTMARLRMLQYLDVGSANFKSIPCSLFHLPQLTFLRTASTPFNKLKLSSIAQVTKLQYLSSYYNNLQGTIPKSMSMLTGLSVLAISYNKLNGSIPSFLASLTNLNQLHLNNNSFTGTIPATIGALTKLTYLAFDNTIQCPADSSPCVVPQSLSSSFCYYCQAFCASCTK